MEHVKIVWCVKAWDCDFVWFLPRTVHTDQINKSELVMLMKVNVIVLQGDVERNTFLSSYSRDLCLLQIPQS